MSIENRKISEEELENVSGGCSEATTFPGDKSKYRDYTVPVDKYCGVIGTKYLFDYSNAGQWIFGELVNTYERSEGLFSFRTHDIKVEDAYGIQENNKRELQLSDYGTYEVNGDKFKMYAKR